MNAQELRIGNLIKLTDTGEIMTVTGIVQDSHGVKVYGIAHDKTYCNPWIDHCEPISLTEDWLIRAGFDYRNYGNSKLVGIKYRLVLIKYMHNYGTEYLRYNEMDGEWHYDHVRFYKHKIKYLHQLQNLYFTLTGSELEINY